MELEKIKYQIMSAKIKEAEIKLSDKQQEAYNSMASGESVFVTGSAGVGKCLGVDTPVIMYNGEVKKIQDIKTGELVMGDDSTPRKVLSTATGKDIMYRISTEKGDSYIVNSAHILTFKASKTIRYEKRKEKYVLMWGDKSGNVKSKHFGTSESAHSFMKTLPDLIDIPIIECIEKNKSRHWREYFQGVYKELYFPEQKVILDPYMLGLWLGCGSKNKPQITTIDYEIISYLEKFSEKNMYRLKQCKKGTIDSINYIINDDQSHKISRFINILREYNVWNNKHIPQVYKANSRENRLLLLAGILDSKGHLSKSGSTFEITQKREILAKDIYFLAKSLGYEVSIKYCEKSCVYEGEKRVGTYWRLLISGNTNEIPVLIKRKKAQPRKQIKNHMVSPIQIEKIGEGNYYGFELDGNHRFLLGNFLVTHNTALIKMFIEVYRQNKIIGVTSTTGISALLFGGTTLHSFLGIGLGTASVEDIVSKIFKRSYLKKRWCELETLIIDEISMLSPALFDKLEEIARTVRHDERPFGGIQLILSGDFLQLPCIGSDKFCFESKKWNNCIDKTVYLTEIMRQKDKKFQECLNNIRIGLITREIRELLQSRINVKIKNDHGIRPTKLYCTNYSVDYINNEELDKLAANDPDFYEYNMETHVFPGVKNRTYIIEKYKKNCNAPETIQLCTGAQVMLLYNLDLDGGLVNGSRGVIKSFVGDVPLVRFMNGREVVIDYHTWEVEENGKKVMRVIQIPLKLAYALTAHKSQGCTLDCVEIDMTNVFDYGQAYVMLSRVKNIENLNILGIDFDKIKAHPTAVEFYQSL